MESIERAITHLTWLADKDIVSDSSIALALLEALNEIAEQLVNIHNALKRT